jgi:Coenzyme PQQ synthesis protein D (PqqD)
MDHPFSSRATAGPEVLFRVLGDESVILNLKTERYLGLNESGTRMWTVLNNSTSIQAAYETLLAEFEVDGEQLRRDLDEFLDELLEQQLIEVVTPK